MRRRGQEWSKARCAAVVLAASVLAIGVATPAIAADTPDGAGTSSASVAPATAAATTIAVDPVVVGAVSTMAAPVASPPHHHIAHAPRSRPDDSEFTGLDWNQVMLGGGTGILPSFEGSGDTLLQPIGGFDGGVGGVSVAGRGTRILVDMNHAGPVGGVQLHYGAVINQNFTQVNLEATDPRVLRLGRREVAMEAGGFVSFIRPGIFGAHDAIGVNLAYTVDASGEHNSYQMVASADYGIAIGHRMAVNLSVAANFAGTRYAEHYFEVSAAGAAASGLPEFADPRGGLKSLGFALVANRSVHGTLGNGLGAFAFVSYTALQGDFAASPVTRIAGGTDQWFIGAGLGYTF
ncbi:MipA/OmpV family protein [Sphingomonas sp. GlSt437]|uniref:MipA/OmpV family protein n=2 Tax=Pseudomonadota TaxID=1224 RepID=UPI003A85CD13